MGRKSGISLYSSEGLGGVVSCLLSSNYMGCREQSNKPPICWSVSAGLGLRVVSSIASSGLSGDSSLLATNKPGSSPVFTNSPAWVQWASTDPTTALLRTRVLHRETENTVHDMPHSVALQRNSWFTQEHLFSTSDIFAFKHLCSTTEDMHISPLDFCSYKGVHAAINVTYACRPKLWVQHQSLYAI